ncbi:MAG: hypothetical protein OEZ02_08875 [Anaerolineae bacterium]|nr:hypothetical protein [Anaerolineae bacterium]
MEREKSQRSPSGLVAVALAVFLLTACAGAAQTALPQTPTDIPMGQLPAPTALQDTPGPQLGFPLGDPNLKATDPTTVRLASGKIQLIEFLAFW